MGDRTSVWIRIGGQVKDLDALVEALENEGMYGGAYASRGNAEMIVEHMKKAAGDPAGVEFTACEVNYGDCDELEEECKRQGLAYEFHWHAGCEYGEGGHIFTPQGEFISYEGEGGAATTTALEIRASKFGSLEELLAYLDRIDTFEPGPLVIPHPLIQAVLKARKEHADEEA